MNIKRKVFGRAGSLVAAVALAVGAVVPAIVPMVSAAGQVQTRSIEISDATPSHTNTTYRVTFTPATTGADSMVIDFCDDGSIIGSTCTPPAGFDASAATFSSVTGMTGWDVDQTPPGFASASTLAIQDTSGTGANSLGTSAISFDLVGVDNPSALGTFWARVYTYNDDSYGSTTSVYVDPDTLGDYEDYGGFAMSTTTLINISATVMETLTFCTSKSAPTAGCTGTDAPDLVLGHGTPKVIDSTAADTDTAHFQISTNALTGAIIRMKTHNTCSGLSRDGGSTCPIVGIGALAAFTAAAAQFGMHVTSVAGGTGTIVADSDYDGTTATNYGMGAAVTSTYGDPIATTNNTATADKNSQLTFAAQASVTTPAGVYSANESLIATGTY